VVARLRHIADHQPAEAMADATMAIATRSDATALLPGIAVPTLLVVGEHDAVTTPAEHTEMAAAIPGATLAVIGGAGHMTALEQPAEFADLLLAHITK
jgi:pimeloyl-ACP methyl ester carboxylesterase